MPVEVTDVDIMQQENVALKGGETHVSSPGIELDGLGAVVDSSSTRRHPLTEVEEEHVLDTDSARDNSTASLQNNM